jgi:preprotein translocase subunit SecA
MSQIPSTTWRMLAQRTAGKELPRGIDAAWDAATGMIQHMVRRRQRFIARAQGVLAMEKNYTDLSDANLRQQISDIRDIFRRRRETPQDIDRAFAIVREVAWRQRSERPFLVQVAGAMAMESGCVAEMATGEGKTLTASLLATVIGWRGLGCHVITVNDYLAKRDAEQMGGIYRFCGLNVSYIEQDTKPPQRRQAYLADITYCTNKEVAADYLRDRLALGRLKGLSSALLAKISDGGGSGTDRLVQRGLHFAIIDEADSVMIDEAVTPLIISGDAPNQEQVEAFKQAVSLAGELKAGEHFRVNQRYRDIDLTSSGKDRLEELAEPMGGIWMGARRREELVTQALTAMNFYVRDKQYVVQEDKIVIVDEFTGRLMPDRTWRDGLHQAIEAKEQITVNPPKDTFARISFQRFFRMYRRLCGMTGTAAEAWREFWQIYHMPVVVIPTNRPCVRVLDTDRVYTTESLKWQKIVEEIHRVHKIGRPVLVGTRSVRSSEYLSQLLTERGLEHQVLNAVRHAEEAQIIAGAGAGAKITVATNMAGRGTDIKLGRGIADLGGLHVIASERHESGRVDRQLFGRAARQGDPGSAVAIVSMADELIRRYAPTLGKTLERRYSNSKDDVSNGISRKVFNLAQRRAEKIAFRQRKSVLHTDVWLDEYLGFAGSET